MEQVKRSRMTADGSKLLAQVGRDEIEAQRSLEEAGYVLFSTFLVMELQMSEPPAAPAPVVGIAIRPFVLGQDEPAVYEADEEAFLDERGKQPRTFEQWGRRFNMHTDRFDPSLCFVAWDRRTVAGCALNEANAGRGEIMHLGVRRPWRRRGLGMALLLHSLQAFYQRGISTVRLNVDSESLTRAHLLYQRVGFQTVDAYMNYIREV
jgi:mycothiol synthase